MLVNSYKDADLVVVEKMPVADSTDGMAYTTITEYLDQLFQTSPIKTLIIKANSKEEIREQLEGMSSPENDIQSTLEEVSNEESIATVELEDLEHTSRYAPETTDPEIQARMTQDHDDFFKNLGYHQITPPKSMLFLIPDLHETGIKATESIGFIVDTLKKRFANIPRFLSFIIFKNSPNLPARETPSNLANYKNFETLRDAMSNFDIYDSSLKYNLNINKLLEEAQKIKLLVTRLMYETLDQNSCEAYVANFARELVAEANRGIERTPKERLHKDDKLAIRGQLKVIEEAGLKITREALYILVCGRVGGTTWHGSLNKLLGQINE